MREKEFKFEKLISKIEVADFLNALASYYEGIEPIIFPEGLDFNLSTARKIKISFKEIDDQISLKLAITDINEKNEEIVSKKDNKQFKSLKKKMKNDFKIINESIKKGEIPEKEVVNKFLDCSRQMITFKGYGDKFYKKYITKCNEFKEACENEEISLIETKYNEINKIKKDCHNAFK